MLFREVGLNAVYSENYAKPVHTFCREKTESMLEQVIPVVTTAL
jgi:hypothetical protein